MKIIILDWKFVTFVVSGGHLNVDFVGPNMVEGDNLRNMPSPSQKHAINDYK